MIPKILVVDDAADTKTLFNQAFKRELEEGIFNFIYRYSVEEALEFIEFIADSSLHLIMTDINLPGRDGLSFLKEVKEKNIQTKIFVFTAYDDSTKRQLAEQYHADKYITKPINFKELRTAILNICSNKI